MKEMTTKEKDFDSKMYLIENALLESVSVLNYNDMLSLGAKFKILFGYIGLPLTHQTPYIGHVIIKFLNIIGFESDKDYYGLEDIKNIPCRIITNIKTGEIHAIGNFLKDDFILVSDLMGIKEYRETMEKRKWKK